MVAVFTGNALGLFNTSLTQVGGGLAGGAGRDRHGVNAATGNLVLQGLDELLTFRGLTVTANRSYNSLGQATGDNGVGIDGWRTGFEASVKLDGALNDAASFVRVYGADGGTVDFAYSGTANRYRSTAGDGAHDTMTWDGTCWVREDGSSRRQELYLGVGGLPTTALLHQIRDSRSDGSDPSVFSVLYAAGRVSEVRATRASEVDGNADNNDALVFTYNAAGQIEKIHTRENNVQRLQATYYYDAQGRLELVYHDLTVGTTTDNTWSTTASVNDGKLHQTRYTYDGTSLRIASVTGSDGQTTSYTYYDSGATAGRIKTVTRGSGDTTTFAYDLVNRRTDVTDALGQKSTFVYDAAGQLKEQHGPARDGLSDVTTYTYDDTGNGDVVQVKTVRGGTLLACRDFRYDGNGNVLREWDAAGNFVERTWTATNQLATQRVFTEVDTDGTADGHELTGGLLTQFFYDATNRLRFTVGPSGEVSENRYDATQLANGTGLLSESRRYLGAAYVATATLTALQNWAASQTTNIQVSGYAYDLAGRLSERREYATVANGVGVLDAATVVTAFLYDAQGLLLTQKTLHGTDHPAGSAAGAKSEAIDYVYDGMGRLLDTIRHDGGTTYVRGANLATYLVNNDGDDTDVGDVRDMGTDVTRIRYIDSAKSIAVTTDGGVTRTEVRDSAGRVLSTSETATGLAARDTYHLYDAAGQLRATQHPGGGRTYLFYDERGNVAAEVDATGAMTEYAYDGLGRRTRTLAHAGRVDTSLWVTGTAPTLALANPMPSLDSVRPGLLEDFADGTLPDFIDTANLDTYAAGFRIESGRLRVQRVEVGTTAYPRLRSAVARTLAEGPLYSAEVSTGSSVANLYLQFMLQNDQPGTASRRAGLYINGPTIYSLTQDGGQASVTNAIGTMVAGKTYVVEAYAGEGGLEFRIHERGQDRDNGAVFKHAVTAAAWSEVRLQLTGRVDAGPVSGQPLFVDNLRQQFVRQTSHDYDLAGRLASSSDGIATTTHEYDGAGRLLRTTVTTPGELDRVVRQFHDASGRVIGTLDAEGFLTRYTFDAGGRLTRVTKQAMATEATLRANGTLTELVDELALRYPSGHAADQFTRYFYDMLDRQVGMLDAEGYLTQRFYDDAGHETRVRQYAKKLAPAGLKSFATLLGEATTDAPVEAWRDTRRVFDHAGRATLEVNHEGTQTKFHYDHAGRLVRTEVAAGETTEVRNGLQWFNAFGELIGEMSGANAAVDADGNPRVTQAMTDAAKLTAFTAYGVRHAYDVDGRRTESIDPAGHKTWYLYDGAGRVAFTVRGALNGTTKNARGEVTETRYNAFGDVAETLAFTGHVVIASPYGYTQAVAAVAALKLDAAAVSSRRQYFHDSRGLLIQQSDAAGGLSVLRYNGFGELVSSTTASGTLAASTTTREYDRRGLQTKQTEGLGAAVERKTSQAFDAFGRVISAIDGRGLATTVGYDRLGRQVSTARATYTGIAGAARIETAATTYDAYSRVLTQTNAIGQVTAFAYSDADRTIAVTTPDNIVVTRANNRHGETLTLTAPGGAVTAYEYDRSGNRTAVIDPLGNVDSSVYDTRGLLFATTAAGGNRVEYTYDSAGRVLTRKEDVGTGRLNLLTTWTYDAQGREVTMTDALSKVTKTEYDGEGRVLRVTRDPTVLNLVTQYAWDAAGRQLSVTEGFGTVDARTVAYAYDALGRRTSETVAPGVLNLTTKYVYDAADNVTSKVDPGGNGIAYAYDQANRLVYTMVAVNPPGDVSPDVAVTRHWYDEAGRLVATRRYATTVELSEQETGQLLSATGGTMLATLDAKMAAVRNDAKDAVQFRVYDAGGRLRYTMTQSEALKAFVSEVRYDAFGNAHHELAYPTAVALPTVSQNSYLMQGENSATIAAVRLSALDTTMASQAAIARQAYRVLDASGQERFAVVRNDAGAGVVVEKQYDLDGNVVATIRHATTIAFDPSDDVAELALQLSDVDADQKQITHYAYDRLGRLRYSVDPMGFVTEQVYDKLGRVTETWWFPTEVVPVDFTDGAIKTALTGQTGVRTALNAYDAAGRLTRITDAIGKYDSFGYDAAGNRRTHTDKLLNVTTFGYDGAGRLTTVTDAINNTETYVYDGIGNRISHTDKLDNVTTYAYDSSSRLIRVTDAHAKFETFEYDALGNRTKHTDKLGNPTTFTHDFAGRALSATDALGKFETFGYDAFGNRTSHADKLGHTTTFAYDFAGRQTRVTDAAGKYETFAYDAYGNRKSYTDKLLKTWDYAYDACGRLVAETAPAVNVFRYSGETGVGMTFAPVRLVTRTTYDARGNVKSRTENGGVGVPLAEQRTTTYDYDSRGNQIRTTFPKAWQIDGTTLQLVETAAAAPTTEVTYDAMGRAVMQKDTMGYYTYKVYDALGRVAHDIDAAGYVTSYEYDAEGRQTRLTRRANPLAANAPLGRSTGAAITSQNWNAAITALGTVGSRVLVTAYDALGQKTSVQQSGAAIDYWDNAGNLRQGTPTTSFEYDANGRVVRESVLVEGGPPERWARTTHYYDVLGRRTHTVDAGNYLTKFSYDDNGRETSRTEYANAVAVPQIGTLPTLPTAGNLATGYDRTVATEYDTLGRKTLETVWRLTQDAGNGTNQPLIGVQTSYVYDAEDRVTAVIANGVRTETKYDTLGRVGTVIESERLVLKENWQQLLAQDSNLTLDSASLYELRNPYTRMDYDAFGNVLRVYRPGGGSIAGIAQSNAANQLTHTRYDRQGRAVVNIDAAGATTYTHYDAADRAVTTWYDLADGQGALHRVTDTFTYDRIGRQLTQQSSAGGTQAVAYNAFGEIVAKAATTADLAIAAKTIESNYDLAGNLVGSDAEGAIRTYRYNLAGQQVAEVRGSVVTRMELDLLGRTTKTVLPSHTDNPAVTSTHQRVFDRWGNVVTEFDPRSGRTDRTYNERNQVVTQKAPEVSVLFENGVATDQRPETRWWYDANGRLIGVKDANGKIDKNVYDAAGRLIRSLDALSYATLHAYDVLGRGLVDQNALGYQTSRTYDALNRVTGVGDFRLTLAGDARTAGVREAYLLDRNGQRNQVTNGEGETQRFDYDGRGLLLRSQTAAGVVMQYGYDALGRRTSETYAPGTAVQATQTWEFDVHGRVVDHHDLAGHDYGYTYDAATGKLSGETSTAMVINAKIVNSVSVNITEQLNRTTTYYPNGLVKRISYASGEYASYEYDASGNRTLEKTYRPATADAPGISVETRTTYDSHSRIATVTTDDLTRTGASQRVLTATYAYDAVGNRRKAVVVNGYGPASATQEGWYTYDGENRVLISAGKFDGTGVTFAELSTRDFRSPTTLNVYDPVGRTKSVITKVYDYMAGGAVNAVDSITYNQRGERISSSSLAKDELAQIQSAFKYDEAGRLLYSVEYFGPYSGGNYYVGSTRVGVLLDGVVKGAISYQYDDDGRLVSQVTWGRHGQTSNPPSGQQVRQDNWVVPLGPNPAQIHYAWDETNATGLVKLEEVLYSDAANVDGYDDAGRLTTYRFIRHAPAWQMGKLLKSEDLDAYTHTFQISYVARDGFLEGKTSGTSSNTNYMASSTESRYDAANRRHLLEDHTVIKKAPDLHSRRQFVYNGDGQILLRKYEYWAFNQWNQGKGEDIANEGQLYNKWYDVLSYEDWNALEEDGREAWYDKLDNTRATYVNGQQIVSVNEGGLDMKALTNLTGFSNSTMGRGKIGVQEGDTLQSLARRAYGSESLWYVIADANGLSGDAPLAAGTTLNLPEVRTSTNDVSTFKPYDPSEMTGPTSPSLPYIAPPDAGCSGVAMVIAAIIIIIVAIYAPPLAAAMANAMGGVAITAGAFAGATVASAMVASGIVAVGASAVVRGVASVAGLASFSWKDVAVDGLTAAFSAGIAQGLQVGATAAMEAGAANTVATAAGKINTFGRVLQGVGNYAGGVVANAAVGRDANFSWKGVAATAVAAFATSKIGGYLPGADGTPTERFFNNVGENLISGTIGATSRRMMGLGRQDWGHIVADAFVNASASEIIRAAKSADAERDASVQPAPERGAEFWVGWAPNQFLQGAMVPQIEAGGAIASPVAVVGSTPSARRTALIESVEPSTPALDQYGNPIRVLDEVIVTGNKARDRMFMQYWNWSQRYRFTAPTAGQDMDDYYRQALREHATDPRVAGPAVRRHVPNLVERQRFAGPTWRDGVTYAMSSQPFMEANGLMDIAGDAAAVTAQFGPDFGVLLGDPKSMTWQIMRASGKPQLPPGLVTPSMALTTIRPPVTQPHIWVPRAGYAPALTKFANKLGPLGLGIEGFQLMVNPNATGADRGHMAVSTVIYGVAVFGGPVGIAIAAGWTLVDTPVQLWASYTPRYGENAGHEVKGWSSFAERINDRDEARLHGIMETNNVDRDLAVQMAHLEDIEIHIVRNGAYETR